MFSCIDCENCNFKATHPVSGGIIMYFTYNEATGNNPFCFKLARQSILFLPVGEFGGVGFRFLMIFSLQQSVCYKRKVSKTENLHNLCNIFIIYCHGKVSSFGITASIVVQFLCTENEEHTNI